MVHTFLTTSDFARSAASLDTVRLGKQRCEAYQILTLISDLRYLSRHFGSAIPGPSQRYDWIRQMASAYKALPYRFVVRTISVGPSSRSLYLQVNLSTAGLLSKTIQARKISKKPKGDETIEIEGYTFYLSDHVMTLGFVYHPAVQMWLTYEDALKHYINCHIEEWKSRGYTNSMQIYNLPKIHQNHRAALREKEIARGEKPWYIQKNDFLQAGEFVDYIWPK